MAQLVSVANEDWLGGVMFALLGLMLTVAVVTDLRERRIPNWLIVSGGAVALAAALTGAGRVGPLNAAGAFVLGLLAFLPFFILGFVGAGDVKLFAVVGSFVGLEALLPVLVYTILAGGVLGIVAVVLSGTTRQFLRNLKLVLIHVVYRVAGQTVAFDAGSARSAVRIPYALAIAAGTVVWMVQSK